MTMRRLSLPYSQSEARLRLECWEAVGKMQMRDGVERWPAADDQTGTRYVERPKWRGLTWEERLTHAEQLVAWVLGEQPEPEGVVAVEITPVSDEERLVPRYDLEHPPEAAA